MLAKGGDDRIRRVAHCDDGEVLGLPSFLARKILGQPIGQRPGGRYSDPLAFELIERADRRIPWHTDTEERRRTGGLADRHHWRSLGDERHLGAGAHPYV